MKVFTVIVSAVFFSLTASAQDLRINAFGGMANYNGDLQERRFTTNQAKTGWGVWLSYDISDMFMLRGGLQFASVKAHDRFQTDSLRRIRNLSFGSNILEGNAGIEFHPLGVRSSKLSPYFFAGIAVYHFNPFAFDAGGQKVFLQPLSTEGQGLSIYPGRDPYQLTQFAIPVAAGVRLQLTERLDAGIEISFRKLFTDYLDDVSNRYPDLLTLLAERGIQAVNFSFRTPELPQHSNRPIPTEGLVRGSPRYNDTYYFAGITLSYRITYKSGYSGSGNFRKIRSGMGCPPVRY